MLFLTIREVGAPVKSPVKFKTNRKKRFFTQHIITFWSSFATGYCVDWEHKQVQKVLDKFMEVWSISGD